MTYECEFCKNSYKTKSSLKNHQKTNIKCLDIHTNFLYFGHTKNY